MTISIIPYDYRIVCDECDDSLLASDFDGQYLDFRGFVDAIKADGWFFSQTDSAWEHVCPDCQAFGA